MRVQARVVHLSDQDVYVSLEEERGYTCNQHFTAPQPEAEGPPRRDRFYLGCCKGGPQPALKVENPKDFFLQQGDMVIVQTSNWVILYQGLFLLGIPFLAMFLTYNFSSVVAGEQSQKIQILWTLLAGMLGCLIGYVGIKGGRFRSGPVIAKKLSTS